MGHPHRTALHQNILDQIQLQGSMSVSHYMQQTMGDCHYGYYSSLDPFGIKGDFITAPEISQFFGEMIAIWIIITWQNLGFPPAYTLCELGPGRGTLMDDILRTLAKISPDCLTSSHVILIETSPKLTLQQQKKLQDWDDKILWKQHFTEINADPQLSAQPLIVIANELFDALPINQYIIGDVLRERVICASPAGELFFTASAPVTNPAMISKIYNPLHPLSMGTIIEHSPEREHLAKLISNSLFHNTGAALIIDYGSMESTKGDRLSGDTLQAVSQHRFCNVLEYPGECDLSSHVDFGSLARMAEQSSCHHAILTQREFLLQLGLMERTKKFSTYHNGAMYQQIMQDIERLISPNQMGELFKVLCIANKTTMMPPFSWQSNPVT